MQLEGKIKELPDLRYTPTGKEVCSFYLEGTRCIAWQELGRQIYDNILVGDKVRVFGTSKERWWTTPEGEKQHAEEFTINRIQVIERPKAIEDCCYYCASFNVDCLRGCYNALGGLEYMEHCKVVDGKCAEEGINNKDCWSGKEQV